MKEKFIKENQELFNNLIDAAERLANSFINFQRKDFLESGSLLDLRNSPLWSPFLSSDYYSFYNQLDKKLPNYSGETPGAAFKKLSGVSIRYNNSTNSTELSFDKKFFIIDINCVVNKRFNFLGEDQPEFSYKPVENYPLSNTGMYILGLVIGALGIAAVAIAFACLNAATGGVGGVALASFGVAAAFGGGFFAKGAIKHCFNLNNNESTIGIGQ